MSKILLRSYIVVTTLKRYKSSIPTEKMKVFTQRRNPITGSSEWDMQHEDYDYHQEIARSAFADMLHDKERNKKYHRALQIAIDKMHSDGKPANVLDIGTGTGLLSIMAAKLGADSIVACEAFTPMAECCAKILKANGVADKVTLIAKRSTDIVVGEGGDMKQKANILVTEVFDTELIGEGALATFTHAHKNLLEKDCIVVPDSAVIYAQVVECPTLQRWNKLNDLTDGDGWVMLKTPQKMKNCPGTAAVHDLQLSQLGRHTFIEISDPIPVFYYDWSGRTALPFKRTVKQKFKVVNPGTAQVVFMWWELNMDVAGKITLNCAPWWCHPDSNKCRVRPQDTIPWRDHWMQGVYYLTRNPFLEQFSEATLVGCQDEYSVWFYLENNKDEPYPRPVCNCGVHMALSRTHVAYLNDGVRNKKYLHHIRDELKEVDDPIVLDLNGSSYFGMAASKLGAAKIYVLEKRSLHIGILNDYIQENSLFNVVIIPEVTDAILKEVTMVVCDPNLSTAIMPWENLNMAYLLYKFKSRLRETVNIIPQGVVFWGMPVQFHDLHKIRMPLGKCEGIDMSIFDELLEKSRVISDSTLEVQPMWEYPTTSRGEPRKMLEIDFRNLQRTYANSGVHELTNPDDGEQNVNGFVLWPVWQIDIKGISTGPDLWPSIGELMYWDPHSRQAIKILNKTHTLIPQNKWKFQVACDLETGQFNADMDVVVEEN